MKSGQFDTHWHDENSPVPVIVDRRMTDGRYTWRIEVRGDWKWHDIKTGITHSNPSLVTVFVMREDEMVKPEGLAVDSLIIEVGQ